MIRHKWKHNGILYNFCVKCGVTKRESSFISCNMPSKNLEKKMPHKMILKKELHLINYFECKVCGLKSYKYIAPNNIYFKKSKYYKKYDPNVFYIPYRIVTKDNKKIGKKISFKNLNCYNIDDIHYLPIYCALTNDEYNIKRILE